MAQKFLQFTVPPGPPGPLAITGVGFQPNSVAVRAVSTQTVHLGAGDVGAQGTIAFQVAGGILLESSAPASLHQAGDLDFSLASLDADGFTLLITLNTLAAPRVFLACAIS